MAEVDGSGRLKPLSPENDSDAAQVNDQGYVIFTPIQFYEYMFNNAADWPSYCAQMEFVTRFGMDEEMAEKMHPGETERAWLQKTFPKHDWDQVSMWWDT